MTFHVKNICATSSNVLFKWSKKKMNSVNNDKSRKSGRNKKEKKKKENP